MAINRCLSSSSSSSSSVLNEVVVSLFHSTNGFKMSRFDQCHKNLNSRRRKFALFVTVVLLLLAVIALSLSFSLTNLRSFLVLSSPPPPFLSFSAVSSQKSSDSHLIQPEDEVTLLKDSIRLIRQQKFELLSWLNRSHSGQINEKYHQILPLDLFVSDDNADDDTESNSKVSLGPGVFWSPVVESLLEDLDHGLHAEHYERFSESLQNATVVSVEPGCGRSPNRLALLSDGRRLCLRYRTNADQIQGEYVSYLLARTLGFAHRNVPPTALLTFDPSSPSSSSLSALKWAPSVASELVTGVARWTPTKAIVATSFLEHLTPAFIPPQFQQGSSTFESSSNSSPSPPPRLHPRKEDLSFVQRKSDLLQLVQWSDLLLFDYLTANVDRLVNNRVNAQWNEQSMSSAPVHNLLRQEEENEEEKESSSEVTGSRLLFLDNESGLFHGYRLLGRFEQHHRALLGSLCIFRRGTVQRLRKLHQLREAELIQALLAGDSNQKKKRMIKAKEEKDSKPSLLPKANLRTLKRRMGTLLQQVASCQRQFGGGEGGVQ